MTSASENGSPVAVITDVPPARGPDRGPAVAPEAVGSHRYGRQRVALVDLLDRVLASGVVVVGEVTLSIADVDLVTVSLRALISSASGAPSVPGAADAPGAPEAPGASAARAERDGRSA